MLHRFFGFGLLTALVVAGPLLAADTKKKDDPTLHPLDAEKLAAGDYTGKLLTLPATDGTFTLQIDTKHYVPKNPDALNAKEQGLQNQIQQSQAKIAFLQGQIASSKTQKEANGHLTQLQKEQTHLQSLQAKSQIKASDLKEVTDTKVYTMQTVETPEIRYMNLPEVFDDEGKVKKYTAVELAKLRGSKTKLPGYEGTLDNLKVGQTVKVTLIHVTPKPAPKKDDPAKTDEAPKKEDVKKDDVKKDDAKKDADDKPPPEKKMKVKMIVILQDPPDDTTDPKGKKKKNN